MGSGQLSMSMSMSKNMAESVTRDMASCDWLKLVALCLFGSQSESKNKSICDCAGARSQTDRSTFFSKSLPVPETRTSTVAFGFSGMNNHPLN